jgi:molybdenum cofactor biosynthesis enzyme MoaA
MSPNDPSYSECCRTIDRIAEYAPAIVVLGGGEPLWRRDVFDIIRHSTDRGLEVDLATNGTLIDEAMAERIRDAGVRRVSVSIDGADAATHDTFRGHQGAFDAAIRGIGLMKKLGVGTGINTTISRHNAHQLLDILALASGLGVRAFHLFLGTTVGCGLTLQPADAIPSAEVELLLRQFHNFPAPPRLQLIITCEPRQFRIAQRQQDSLVYEDWGESRRWLAAEPFAIYEPRNLNADNHADQTAHTGGERQSREVP